jgi:S-layer homology domain
MASKSYRKFMATGLSAAVVATVVAPVAGAASYTDVKDTHWAKEAIDYVSEVGYMQGNGKGFAPDENMTRAEAAQLFTNIFGIADESLTEDFSDVSEKDWFHDAVAAVLEHEIMNGMGNGKFAPESNLTRGQLAAIVVRAYGFEVEESEHSFSDIEGHMFEEEISILASLGLVNGVGGDKFAPDANVTRAQMAQIIYNIDNPGFVFPEVTAVKAVDTKTVEVTVDGAWTQEDVDALVEAGYELTVEGKSSHKVGKVTVKAADASASEDTTTLVLSEISPELVAGEALSLAVDGEKIPGSEFKYEAPATPEVTSVSAINGTQVVVKFNHKVDGDNLGTYTFSDGKNATAKLLADEKSVLLTLDAAYDNTKAHTVAVTVENAVVAGTENTFPIFTSVVAFEDKVAAGVAEVKSVTKGATADKATITFTEPVKEGLIKLNGTSYQISAYLGGKESVSSVELTSLSLDSSKTHSLEVVNLKDAAGNVVALTTKQFNVTKDAVAPVVSSVEAHGDYKVLVTFDKKINATTVAAGDVKVADELLNDIPVASFLPLNGDTTGTKFVVTLDKSNAKVSGLFANKTSRALTLVFADKSVDDALGNQLAAVTKSVTLAKDATAPSVTGITYKKNADKEVETITVTFDENITDITNVPAFLSKFTVVNANGVQKNNILTGATVTVSGKTAVINITDVALYGKHSFQIAAGASQDLALSANNSAAYTGIVDFGPAPSSSGTFELPANAIDDSTENVIKITFAKAVKGGAVVGSATDVNNYSVNGKALPTGTTITLDANQLVATITLAEGFTANDTDAIFTINNVQQLTGEVIKPVTTTISVVDNVAPVLESARVIDADTIELTYSEALAVVSGGDVLDELEIYEGTTKKTLTTVTASNVTGYSKKVVVDIDSALDLTKEISVKTLATTTLNVDIADLNNNNAHKEKVSVVVVK